MRIGLYTTQPELRQQLDEALENLGQSSFLNLSVHEFDSFPEISASLTEAPMDLLLFDMDGTDDPKDELIRASQIVPNCDLILLCSDTRFAIFGYTVRAKDYLTTPINSEDLVDILTRFLRERLEGHEHYLPLKMNGVWSKLNMRHITYLESAGHALIFHMNDGRSFRVISSFSNYQTQLEMNRDFFRCHKSYVVNMRYVVGWELNNLTLADGKTINISRPYRQVTRSFYACYVTQSRDLPFTAPVLPEKEETV